MKFLIGITITVLSVIGGYIAMGGNWVVLWQPWEFVIICGAALGAFIVSNSVGVLKSTLGALIKNFFGKPYTQEDYIHLLSLLYMIFRLDAKDIKRFEGDFDNPSRSVIFKRFNRVFKNPTNVQFLCDYMRLIINGSKISHQLEPLMDEEIETLDKELGKRTRAMQKMADALPALGIVAAVLGIIKAMGAIAEAPEVLGMLIGGALVGTFLGIFLSYGVVGPLANSLQERREQEISYLICIKAALIAYMNSYAPQICVEYGRKVIPQELRPSFDSVEKTMQRLSRESN